jgi:hypothetical protein
MAVSFLDAVKDPLVHEVNPSHPSNCPDLDVVPHVLVSVECDPGRRYDSTVLPGNWSLKSRWINPKFLSGTESYSKW